MHAITKAQVADMVNLFHLARTALAYQSCTRWGRINWGGHVVHRRPPGCDAHARLESAVRSPGLAKTGYAYFTPKYA